MADDDLYRAPPDLEVTADWMNRLLASINLRLRALEAVKVTLESTVEALRLVGLQRIDAAIAPLIVETQQQIDDLGEQLGDVEASIAELLSGGVPADNVTETATRAFVTPAQKTEIGQLRTDLTAVDDAKLPKSGGTLTGTLTLAGNASSNLHAVPKQQVDSLIAVAVNGLVNAAPGALDTLQELAAALGNDANYAATITTALAGKAAIDGSNITGRLATLASVVTDWNNAVTNGFYRGTDTAMNGPGAIYCLGHVEAYDGNWVLQTLVHINTGTLYRRMKSSGAWGSWAQISDAAGAVWHPANLIKANQAKAEAGVDDADFMTALKTKQAIDKFAGGWTSLYNQAINGLNVVNVASLGAYKDLMFVGRVSGQSLRINGSVDGTNFGASFHTAVTSTEGEYFVGVILGIRNPRSIILSANGGVLSDGQANYNAGTSPVGWMAHSTGLATVRFTPSSSTWGSGSTLAVYGR